MPLPDHLSLPELLALCRPNLRRVVQTAMSKDDAERIFRARDEVLHSNPSFVFPTLPADDAPMYYFVLQECLTEEAASRGHSEACANLGMSARDWRVKFDYLGRAADQGHVGARNVLERALRAHARQIERYAR